MLTTVTTAGLGLTVFALPVAGSTTPLIASAKLGADGTALVITGVNFTAWSGARLSAAWWRAVGRARGTEHEWHRDGGSIVVEGA